MRGFWITIAPMTAAAALVIWGGERLSRRVTEQRQPADRTRLLDFSALLRDELDRLDGLFEKHLSDLTGLAGEESETGLTTACNNLIGVRYCKVFETAEKARLVQGPPYSSDLPRPPDIEIEGSKNIFNPERTVLLPKNLEHLPEKSGWLKSPDAGFRVHWRRMEPGGIAAFLIDDREIQARLREHLAEWMEGPGGPLRESGERFAVTGSGNLPLAGALGDKSSGPAALVIPHRTSLGEWQVSAWDRKTFRSESDVATLSIAGCFAGLLLVAGGFLFVERRRGMKLAEERVSFVNRVSHELGTPLTNILLNLDLALDSLRAKPQEAERRLSLVGEEVQRMARLVANVLTFSRGERKSLEIHPAACVPDEVIARVLEQFEPALVRRKIHIEWQRSADAVVLLDPDALSQIIGNLISNVEKYAHAGGWLGLSSGLENGRLSVRVSDRGPGIARKHGERIFGAFERVGHGVNEGASGTGLGLAIARDLARRMDGELSFSPDERGAVFELDVPAPMHPDVIPLKQHSA